MALSGSVLEDYMGMRRHKTGDLLLEVPLFVCLQTQVKKGTVTQHTHTQKQAPKQTHTHKQTNKHKHKHKHTNTNTQTQTHTHTHAHTHATHHMHARMPSFWKTDAKLLEDRDSPIRCHRVVPWTSGRSAVQDFVRCET